MRNVRGTSLIELTVASALIFLALGIATAIFSQFTPRRTEETTARLQAKLALQQVAADLRATQFNALTVLGPGQSPSGMTGFGMLRCTGWDHQGQKFWASEWVVVYRDPSTRQLIRKRIPASSDLPLDGPRPFPPAMVERMATREDVPTKVLIGKVTSFSVSQGRSNPLEVKLEVEYPGLRGMLKKVVDERAVALQSGV